MANDEDKTELFSYLIIGGGIAGVTCAETLSQLDPTATIGIISVSSTIKTVINLRRVTKLIEDFDIEEQSGNTLMMKWPNVCLISGVVTSLVCSQNCVHLSCGRILHYNKLCLATGASPKLIDSESPLILGIRETESVLAFESRLKGARRVMLVGNGGIATELAFAVSGCELIWVVKHATITVTFLDAGAAAFLRPHLSSDSTKKEENTISSPSKSCSQHHYDTSSKKRYTISRLPALGTAAAEAGCHLGGALGPSWADGRVMRAAGDGDRHIQVIYKCEVSALYTPEQVSASSELKARLKDSIQWPLYVLLTDNSLHGVDFLVSATGVIPNVADFLPGNQFTLSSDGGLLVDDQFRCPSHPDVYAVGDCCTADWSPIAPHWFQMRLWSQARQMGFQAGKNMYGHRHEEGEVPLDFCFELFTHVTRFFGVKVVLLGLYNGQGLPAADCEILLRVTPGVEYVKCVLQNGRMQGCLLLGDTDLEETMENLILNQLDLSAFGEDLLDPNVDIEDYFD